ncbi:universal stress protein [Chloroflexota bacterium]
MTKHYQKFNKILLPLDGSDFSEIASSYAPDLVKIQGVELTLIRVLVSESRRSLEEELAYLGKQVKTINAAMGMQTESGALKPKINKELVIGHPVSEIFSYVQNKNIDLVIMATHGRSGIANLIMDSVAKKVVRASEVPVLLIKTHKGEIKAADRDTDITRKVLIPLDGTKLNESVIPLIQAFISQFGDKRSEIILLSVYEPSSIQSSHSVVTSEAVQAAGVDSFKRRREVNQYLSELAGQVRNDGFNISTKLITGNPTEKIIEQARKNGVSLIAMATHGRSGITKMVYGGVAEAVIRSSRIPILVIRPK